MPPPTLKGFVRNPVDFVEGAIDSDVMRRGETPSVTGACSARGMAKLGACMVNGGSHGELRLMGPETCEQMQSGWKKARDVGIMGGVTVFSRGGVNRFR